MQEKFLKDLVSLVVGQSAEKIVDILYKKKNVNEFLIAKKLNVTINQARNILYRLADEGMVVFTRKKDKKSGGWYTYFWTLRAHKSLVVLREKLVDEVNRLNEVLESKKTKQFYTCNYCGMEVSEENALLYDFTCPECGEVFEMANSQAHIESIEKSVNVLNEKIELLDKEIGIMEAKRGAAIRRKEKRVAKEKAEKRRAARKKSAKKTTKKKTTKKKTSKKRTAKKKTTKKKVAKKTTKKKTTKKKTTKKRSVAGKILKKISGK